VVAKTLPPPNSVLQQDHEPEQALQQKVVKRGKSMIPRVLVQWKGLPANMATWEDFHNVQRHFLTSPAWGQVSFKGEGNVMNSARA